jgi:hypothetical protein
MRYGTFTHAEDVYGDVLLSDASVELLAGVLIDGTHSWSQLERKRLISAPKVLGIFESQMHIGAKSTIDSTLVEAKVLHGFLQVRKLVSCLTDILGRHLGTLNAMQASLERSSPLITGMIYIF